MPEGEALVRDLDFILDSDPDIDELGFVIPEQLASLHSLRKSSSHFVVSFSEGETKDKDECVLPLDNQIRAERSGFEEKKFSKYQNGKVDITVTYDTSAFWCYDHKLAIAVLALSPMYQMAKSIFSGLQAQYSTCSILKGFEREQQRCFEMQSIEYDLMKYSRILLIVNCDYPTAWNIRKRVLLNGASKEQYDAELRLARLVLTYAPKSEETWTHRRWVIGQMVMLELDTASLNLLVESESQLVELIAERSPMNYRAWRHRCWLVSKMSSVQASLELQNTKSWAVSHVADTCCFHYRRCLFQHLFDNTVRSASDIAAKGFLQQGHAMTAIWKEELSWNRELLTNFIGHEALWMHRRFLINILFQYLSPKDDELVDYIKSEFLFLRSCITACKNGIFEISERQVEYAAAYKMWLLFLMDKGADFGNEHYDIILQEEKSDILGFMDYALNLRKSLWEGIVSRFR